MEYNLDELDANLSSSMPEMDGTGGPSSNARSGGVVRTNPGTRRGSVVTMPSMRRASLKPRDDAAARAGLRPRRETQLNLFHFELRELARQVLMQRGQTRASYHEYAVFAPPDGDEQGEYRSPSLMASGADGLRMLQQAVRHGYGLDDQGAFVAKPPGRPRLQGRVRQFIVDRETRPGTACGTSNSDGLHMTVEDFEALDLHAATLPSIQRVTSECSFWNPRKDTLYIVFSFSAKPQPPYDFLSMSYNLKSRTTTALIRRSFDTRWHDEEALNEYEQRLDACRELWAHPLVLPIVLLQVQLLRTEEAVVANNEEVMELEGRVDDLTGTPRRAPPKFRRRTSSRGEHFPGPLKRLSTFKDFVGEKVSRRSHEPPSPSQPQAPLSNDYIPPQTIHLMKEAHDVLKGAIQLLDTLRWMERAVKLLIQTGDELDACARELKRQGAGTAKADHHPDDDEEVDDLCLLWHEIKQYLESIWRLCTALETDRRMSELRCRAQIDIIYSKMAQEDNNLNARMAVASTRDSSSMKALAVITAVFLPGEYMSSLFGQAFFNWEYGTKGDPALSEDATQLDVPNPVIMPLFWVYWCFTIPLTIIIIVSWRAWWVNQDRFFRRHLSPELSNERYWTTDGKPRELETTFMQDMLSVFKRSGGGSTTNRTVLGTNPLASGGMSSSSSGRPSPISRRSTFESDLNHPTTPASVAAKDAANGTDTEDWEGPRKRTRTISFAMRSGPREPPSAV